MVAAQLLDVLHVLTADVLANRQCVLGAWLIVLNAWLDVLNTPLIAPHS